MAEEDDKTYLKRVADRLPVPRQLPETYGDYFLLDGAEVVAVDELRPAKTPGENAGPALNAAKFMLAASRGLVARRAPLSVRRLPGGGYLVVDGNATLAAVSRYGWRAVPVIVRHD